LFDHFRKTGKWQRWDFAKSSWWRVVTKQAVVKFLLNVGRATSSFRKILGVMVFPRDQNAARQSLQGGVITSGCALDWSQQNYQRLMKT